MNFDNYVCDGQLTFTNVNMTMKEEYYTKTGKVKKRKALKEEKEQND